MQPRVGFLTTLVCVAVALAPAGLGHTVERVYSRAALPKLVAPIPPLPTNTHWFDETESDGDSRAFGIEFFEEPALIAEMRRVGFVRGYRRVWGADDIEPYDYRTADAYAYLFRTPAGAKAGLSAFKRRIVFGSRIRWPEFGATSFGAAARGSEPAATYVWRIGNVLLQASASCGGVDCEFDDIVPVTHAYARVLKRNAKTIR